MVALAKREQARDQKRPAQAARLVERGVQAEAPAGAGAACGVGEHGATDRGADRAPEALGDQQQHGDRPGPGEREQRHRKQVDQVPGAHDRPVVPAAIGRAAGEVADAIAEEYAEASDHADDHRRRAEHPEERAGNTAPAFVRHIGE